jgi:hypothetical protein
VQPGEGPLDDPAQPPEAGAVFSRSAGDAMIRGTRGAGPKELEPTTASPALPSTRASHRQERQRWSPTSISAHTRAGRRRPRRAPRRGSTADWCGPTRSTTRRRSGALSARSSTTPGSRPLGDRLRDRAELQQAVGGVRPGRPRGVARKGVRRGCGSARVRGPCRAGRAGARRGAREPLPGQRPLGRPRRVER